MIGCFQIKNGAAMHQIIPLLLVILGATALAASPTTRPFADYTLDYTSPVDPALQAQLEKIDAELRGKFGMTTAQTAVGVFDLNTLPIFNSIRKRRRIWMRRRGMNSD
jgi:hypothetical protein